MKGKIALSLGAVGAFVAGGVATESTTRPASASTNYWFYNYDVCAYAGASDVCLWYTGGYDMRYGTLSMTTRGANKTRAGAGYGNSTNRCASSQGPLPSGVYGVVEHTDNRSAGSINGRTWYLTDKRCNASNPSSTLRTELFIHTEETSSQGQYCPTSGDDQFCWEDDNDYLSNGCIKVSYKDVQFVDNEWHNYKDGAAYVTVDA